MPTRRTVGLPQVPRDGGSSPRLGRIGRVLNGACEPVADQASSSALKLNFAMHRCCWLLNLALAGFGLAQVSFEDRAASVGLGFRHHASPTPQKYLPETMGGGVALFDYDNDGFLDVFFVNGGGIATASGPVRIDRSQPVSFDRLYRNSDGRSFQDVTEQAGVSAASKTIYGMGAATGDYDNDGNVDLFVTGYGGTILYRNRGDGTFEDRTEQSGAAVMGWSASAGFFDVDSDGDLDLFVTRYLEWSFETRFPCGERIPVYCSPRRYPAATSVLLRNEGDGTFADVSGKWGLENSPGKALGVAFNDADADGLPDVLVANDSTAQQLFLNRRTGRFVESALAVGLAYNEDGGSFAGMGIDFEDYDNDGLPDVITTTLAKELYALYRNEGSGSFRYVTRQSGLAEITARMSGWGAKFVDFDHDGWKDYFAAQSHVLDNVDALEPGIDYRQPPLVARNERGRFVDVSGSAGPAFGKDVAGRGAAFGDLDNDGDVDVIVGVLDSTPMALYSNAADLPHHWIQIRLAGGASARDGQGARVEIRSAAGEQVRYATTSGSYLSASDPRLHFGLGPDAQVDRITVNWPSGAVQVLGGVAVDRAVTIEEPEP